MMPDTTKNTKILTDEAYKNLASAIILQACKDYKTNVKEKYDKNKSKHFNPKINIKPSEVVRFFNSGWFSTLCGDSINGKTVMKQLEENYLEYGDTLILPFSDKDKDEES